MMKLRMRLVALVFCLIAVSPVAAAAEDATRGEAIVAEMYARERGFSSFRMDMEMILRDRHGQQSVRKMRGAVLETDGDGDKHLMLFESPADIRHTAFLSFAHADKPDDQWLYLPALKRTRRIASDSKSGSFMGSEFSFEDLTSQLPRKFSHRYLGDEDTGGTPCFKVERTPRYEGSGYTKQVLWIDRKRYVTLKAELYDRRGALQKTLESGDFAAYGQQLLKPGWMNMVNHQTGKSTRIDMSGYKFRDGSVDKRDFEPQRLEYVR